LVKLEIKQGQKTFKHIHEVGDFAEQGLAVFAVRKNSGINFPKSNHKYPK
jgi:hypothetical protein